MGLLPQFLNDPTTILGLSVLNNANRPAYGLLQGLNTANTLQNQQLTNQQMQAAILYRQQQEDEQRRIAQLRQQQSLNNPMQAAQNLFAGNDLEAAKFAAGLMPRPGTPPSGVAYALALGLQPGSPEFNDFVSKFALKPASQINIGQLNPTDALKYYDPNTGGHPSAELYQQGPQAVEQAGYQLGSPKQQEMSQTSRSADEVLQKLENLVSQTGPDAILQPYEGIPGRGKQAFSNLTDYAAQNERGKNIRRYMGQQQAFMSTIARLYGERGTLTNQDIDRVADIFANVLLKPDQPDVGQEMIKDLRGFVKEMNSRGEGWKPPKGETLYNPNVSAPSGQVIDFNDLPP